MNSSFSSRDKLLFTLAPPATSDSAKEAMPHDARSWHFEFNDRVCVMRGQLLAIGRNEPHNSLLELELSRASHE